MSQMRLDKWLADAGAGTRSQVKEYLKKGRVRVNGETVKKPETKISEETDEVSFDGKILSRPGLAWYMFHKPAGCITAARNGRTETVMDLFCRSAGKGSGSGRTAGQGYGRLSSHHQRRPAEPFSAGSRPSCGKDLLCRGLEGHVVSGGGEALSGGAGYRGREARPFPQN